MQGADDISELILRRSVCWFGQGGGCGLVVIQGGLCLLCRP